MKPVRMRTQLLAILLTGIFCGGCSVSDTTEEVVFAGPTMGTQYHVKAVGLPKDLKRGALAAQIDELLASINQSMSTYLESSEISRFNRSRSTDWQTVSPEFVEVATAALRVSELTGGAFDPTVGPLVNLWSFGPEGRPRQTPEEVEIATTLANVGYQELHVRESPPALRKTNPQLYVDLSAIAKGFAVDKIAELLRGHGIGRFMVEIGGEVRTLGKNANGEVWKIGIERPIPGQRSLQRVIAIEKESLATSGDYRNFFEQDGTKFSHTIDPRTGWPVRHGLASVSVIHEQCMVADAFATAIMVMGPDTALEFARSQQVDVLLLVRDEDGFTEHATAGFTNRFVE